MSLTERINNLMLAVKNGVLALASVLGIGISSIGIYNGVRSDEVTLDDIKVPATFEEQGYKSDITTVRILDQISKYQLSSGSAKERVSFFGNQQSQPTKIELAGSGVDVKAVQSYVRDSLGIQTSKISGEITTSKVGESTQYHVKIRKSPENIVLVDFKTTGTVEVLIDLIALNILEATDPHIAAAVHWGKGDEVNALRMIDVVLGNNNPDDDKFSLNLKAYIDITKKRLGSAQQDIEKLEKIAPDFIPLLSSKSWLAREKGDFSQSLELADLQIKRAPEKWWGYQARALSLQGLKRNEEAAKAYLKLIAMKPDSPSSYLIAGRFFASQSDFEHATDAFRTGVSRYRDHSGLSLAYADTMQQAKLFLSAEGLYRQFQEDPKSRLHALIGLVETLEIQNKTDELKKQKSTLKIFLEQHPLTDLEEKVFQKRLEILKI